MVCSLGIEPTQNGTPRGDSYTFKMHLERLIIEV
jgi:hypothetical protein